MASQYPAPPTYSQHPGAPTTATVGPVGQLTSAVTGMTAGVFQSAWNALDGQRQPPHHQHHPTGNVPMQPIVVNQQPMGGGMAPHQQPMGAGMAPHQQPMGYNPATAMAPVTQPPMDQGIGIRLQQVPQVPQGGAVSSEDRWALLWTILKLYYCVDATGAFILALFGLIASLVTRGDQDPGCSTPYLAISVLIFLTRLMDFAHGAASLCCCCCCIASPPESQQSKDTIGRSIKINITVCITQMVLSVAQLGTGAAGLLGALGDCPSLGPTLAVVFGALLFINAGEELYVWGCAWLIYKEQDKIQLPGWVDGWIPGFAW
eukprot:CAMPEP_0197866726 /NCGR_PEP_ID=MMETSP1438-20131217/44371_1 /TAXON_ID=1461541 /ORGANISM="Pterosperma sp., Strain CCMP1384" /LENGTH=317 /DNA_ID=CAMNT_0043485315 /DNA_START=239 /DNA_END=1189 /DNA_ORIENTATION=-